MVLEEFKEAFFKITQFQQNSKHVFVFAMQIFQQMCCKIQRNQKSKKNQPEEIRIKWDPPVTGSNQLEKDIRIKRER